MKTASTLTRNDGGENNSWCPEYGSRTLEANRTSLANVSSPPPSPLIGLPKPRMFSMKTGKEIKEGDSP